MFIILHNLVYKINQRKPTPNNLTEYLVNHHDQILTTELKFY